LAQISPERLTTVTKDPVQTTIQARGYVNGRPTDTSANTSGKSMCAIRRGSPKSPRVPVPIGMTETVPRLRPRESAVGPR
jgi:hypothetical protein